MSTGEEQLALCAVLRRGSARHRRPEFCRSGSPLRRRTRSWASESLRDVIALPAALLGRSRSRDQDRQDRHDHFTRIGNSLRAIVTPDDSPDEDIAGVNIPTGIPLVYELHRRDQAC